MPLRSVIFNLTVIGNETTNSTANETTNCTANETTNCTVNETTNCTANETTNCTAKETSIDYGNQTVIDEGLTNQTAVNKTGLVTKLRGIFIKMFLHTIRRFLGQERDYGIWHN